MYEVWDRLRAECGPGWYWMGHHLRGGDLYHACSFIAEFIATHGSRYPVFLVLEHASQASLASLFEEHFAKILVARGFPNSFNGWSEFFGATGMPTFDIDTPLVVHPHFNQETTRFSVDFLEQNRHFGLTWMQLYKQMLHLNGTAEPRHPVRKPQIADQARLFCEANDVAAGRSVILFPYAQSLPVKAQDHFAQLAIALSNDGHDVFTSVAGSEQPIAGTRALSIPFALLPDIVEHAGWVIAVRSGICDIVSPVPCRKSFIYPNDRELRFWSTAALGLCRDAIEIPFDFGSGTPERLISLLLSGNGYGGLPFGREQLSARIGNGQSQVPVTTLSFTELQRREAAAGLRGPETTPAPVPHVIRLLDVPPRDHPRMAALIATILDAFADRIAGPTTRFYACRDSFEADVLEEIDRSLLLAGDYVSAGSWHSIVAVRGVGLETLLPADVRELILAVTPVLTGEAIRMEDAYRERLGVVDILSRPVVFKGLQIGSGWCDPEPWGIWTKGLHSTMRFTLAQPPVAPVRVTIHFMACISDAFPELRVTLRANSAPVGTVAIVMGAGMDTLEFEIPPAAIPDRTCVLALDFAEVRSPEQQGGSPDGRLLGLGLRWLRVDIT